MHHQNADGNTFAHVLANDHSMFTVKIAEQLIKKKNYIPYVKNKKGETALDRSINNNYICTAFKLLGDKKYNDVVFEFDTLDELREFDETYVSDTRSELLKECAKELNCKEEEITEVLSYKDENNAAAGFMFTYNNEQYRYSYEEKVLKKV